MHYTAISCDVMWPPLSRTEGIGEDYIRPISTYQLRPNERIACVNLIVLNDVLLEATETLQARLLRVTDTNGNVLNERLTLDPDDADIFITDNDREL